MSATSRPDWGRASGALSILTAIAGRDFVAPLASGRPVSAASGAPSVVTVPSDTFVSGVTAATGFGAAPPPQAAVAASAARLVTTTAVRRNCTGTALLTGGRGALLDISASALEPAARQSELSTPVLLRRGNRLTY